MEIRVKDLKRWIKIFIDYINKNSKSFRGHPLSVFAIILVIIVITSWWVKCEVDDPLFIIVSLTAGWVAAFCVGSWNQKKTFVSQFRYEAGKELIGRLALVNSAIIELSGVVFEVELVLDEHYELTGEVGNSEIPKRFKEKFKNYEEKFNAFLESYSINEIFFVDFQSHLNILCTQNFNIGTYIFPINSGLEDRVKLQGDQCKIADRKHALVEYIKHLRPAIHEMWEYLKDIKIGIMNNTVGDILDVKLKTRDQHDSTVLTLDQIVAGLSKNKQVGGRPPRKEYSRK